MNDSNSPPHATFTSKQLEQHRLRELADAADDREITIDELRDRFSPGSFGCHEALKMASVYADTIARHLCEHPAILANPDWYRLASEAQSALLNLYQDIGDAHLILADPEPPAKP